MPRLRDGLFVWLLALAACPVSTPVGRVNSAAVWNVSCGTLKAQLVDADRDAVAVELTLVGDESAPRKTIASVDRNCELELAKAKLVRPSKKAGAGDKNVVASGPLAPMVVAPGSTAKQRIELELDGDPDEIEDVEIVIVPDSGPALSKEVDLPVDEDGADD